MKDYAKLVSELREYQRMADEISDQIEAIKDEIKAGLNEQNIDVLTGKDFKITFKPVFSERLDTKALKATMPDVAAQFMKTSVSKRLVIK